MVKLLFDSIRTRISNAEWMSDETRVKALEKLSAMRVKIGYPDEWFAFSYSHCRRKDISLLAGQMNDGVSFLQRLATISEWSYLDEIKNGFNHNVDKNRWYMSPQTVNAYYSPNGNEIVFPAAILVPPFYFAPTSDLHSIEAKLNRVKSFGAIGAVIGISSLLYHRA